uniref:Uncharacterized protein n=1 Tax=Amphiprion percula TaxID=161767 RepID=A0A3P8TCL7_AMPPE
MWMETCSSSGLPSSCCKKSVHPGRLQHLFMTTCSASDLVETQETRENPWRLEELVETRKTRRAGEGVGPSAICKTSATVKRDKYSITSLLYIVVSLKSLQPSTGSC